MHSLAVILLLACAVSPAGKPEDVLLQADRDFNTATSQKRLDGWMQFMADDAVLGHEKPVIGKAAIRTAMQDVFANPASTLTWAPEKAELFKAGGLGYTSGRWQSLRVTEKGEKRTAHGSYLTVWKKQPDGSWKVIYDTGSPDPPAAKSAQ